MLQWDAVRGGRRQPRSTRGKTQQKDEETEPLLRLIAYHFYDVESVFSLHEWRSRYDDVCRGAGLGIACFCPAITHRSLLRLLDEEQAIAVTVPGLTTPMAGINCESHGE